jgi:ADP-dependent NAD(P)H-hydrate dehydratase
MPGGVILAALAGLRAGAGKLQIITANGVAQLVAAAVLEACVFGAPSDAAGHIGPAAANACAKWAKDADAVLIGPGMRSRGAAFAKALLPRVHAKAIVLDAEAIGSLREDPNLLGRWRGRAVLTPHVGEMAYTLGMMEGDVRRGGASVAAKAAKDFTATVVLKGSETFVASPGERVVCVRDGDSGLATSGSGDVLAGIIVGLLARGLDPRAAGVWGAHLHALAGRALHRIGPIGYLARELLSEIPRVMARASS